MRIDTGGIFDFFVTFASAFDGAIQMRATIIYFGLISPERVLPGGLSALQKDSLPSM